MTRTVGVPLCTFFSIFVFGISPHAQAQGGKCQKVKVDCTTHKMQIDNGAPTTINCGKNGTTPTTNGKVGGPHRGTIVPDGVDIKAPGMGQDGGGKVFHTPNPKSMSGTPTGSDSTRGCVACTLEDLNKLKNCQGASLEIKGNGEGRGLASSSGRTGSSGQ